MKYEGRDFDDLLKRIDLLITSINTSDVFITDFSLIEQIIKKYDVETEDIYEIMKEIDIHNKKIAGLVKENQVRMLLKKYNFETNITEYEENLLNISDLEEKLAFLSSIPEYDFLKKPNLNLRLTLILLAPLENIKEIYNISRTTNLNIQDIFPIFYLNENFKIQDNSFYSNFTGAFETFTNNIKLFINLGYDINNLYENYGGLFYADTKLLISNMEILTKYDISLKNLSILESDDLENKINRFIELGLYNYIKENPQILLNKDKALFHRIYYAKKNNLPVKNRFLSKDITSLNGYNINEENYQNVVLVYKEPRFQDSFYQNVRNSKPHIIDDRIIKNVIKILDDSFRNDDNTYVITDIIISRNKVINLFQSFLNLNTNNINYFEGLIFAITDNLFITKDEFDLIILNVLGKYVNSNLLTNEEAINIAKSFNVDNDRIRSIFEGDRLI